MKRKRYGVSAGKLEALLSVCKRMVSCIMIRNEVPV